MQKLCSKMWNSFCTVREEKKFRCDQFQGNNYANKISQQVYNIDEKGLPSIQHGHIKFSPFIIVKSVKPDDFQKLTWIMADLFKNSLTQRLLQR